MYILIVKNNTLTVYNNTNAVGSKKGKPQFKLHYRNKCDPDFLFYKN